MLFLIYKFYLNIHQYKIDITNFNIFFFIYRQNPRYNTVVLGSHKTLFSTKSLYEQVRKVDGVKDLFNSKAVLLHLQEPAKYSTMVKPMIPSTV